MPSKHALKGLILALRHETYVLRNQAEAWRTKYWEVRDEHDAVVDKVETAIRETEQ